MVIDHFFFLMSYLYCFFFVFYLHVCRKKRKNKNCTWNLLRTVRLWGQAKTHPVLKTTPIVLISLNLNNYFPPGFTLFWSHRKTKQKKKSWLFPHPCEFFVHNSCQEAFLHLDTNMSCRFKVQGLLDTCRVRSLKKVVLICADFRHSKKIGQKKKKVKDHVKEWLATRVLSYLSLQRR